MKKDFVVGSSSLFFFYDHNPNKHAKRHRCDITNREFFTTVFSEERKKGVKDLLSSFLERAMTQSHQFSGKNLFT